jgi:hypothetical protein
MNIDKIEEMWESDCAIDQNRLDDASIDCAKLHAKYLSLYNKARLKLKHVENEYVQQRQLKWRWYGGKMTKEEMDAHDLEYDPFNGGVRPLKGDLNLYIDSDKDISQIKLKIEYYKIVVSTLEEIIGNIRWRSSTIKNIIDWKKFTSGV